MKEDSKLAQKGKEQEKCTLLSGTEKKLKSRCFWPGTKALLEIHKFQKPTGLLILKWPYYQMILEILQFERSWMKIQASAILALHEAAEAYLMRLLEDSNICAIHAK